MRRFPPPPPSSKRHRGTKLLRAKVVWWFEGDHAHSRRQHRGIWFLIAPADEPGYFYFEFEIGGRTVRRRTETNLASLAIHRARRAIDRKLKRMTEA